MASALTTALKIELVNGQGAVRALGNHVLFLQSSVCQQEQLGRLETQQHDEACQTMAAVFMDSAVRQRRYFHLKAKLRLFPSIHLVRSKHNHSSWLIAKQQGRCWRLHRSSSPGCDPGSAPQLRTRPGPCTPDSSGGT